MKINDLLQYLEWVQYKVINLKVTSCILLICGKFVINCQEPLIFFIHNHVIAVDSLPFSCFKICLCK